MQSPGIFFFFFPQKHSCHAAFPLWLNIQSVSKLQTIAGDRSAHLGKPFLRGWPHIFRLEFHEHAPHDRLWSQNPSQNTWEHSLHIRSPGFSARARALIGRGAEGPEGLAWSFSHRPRRVSHNPRRRRRRSRAPASEPSGSIEAWVALRTLSGKRRMPPIARRRRGSAISGPAHFGKFRSRLSEMAARRQGERRLVRGLEGRRRAARAALGNLSFAQAAAARP